MLLHREKSILSQYPVSILIFGYPGTTLIGPTYHDSSVIGRLDLSGHIASSVTYIFLLEI